MCYHDADGNEIRPEHSGDVTALILQVSGRKATGITLEILREGTLEPCYFKLTDLVQDQYSNMINRRMAISSVAATPWTFRAARVLGRVTTLWMPL